MNDYFSSGLYKRDKKIRELERHQPTIKEALAILWAAIRRSIKRTETQ